MGEKTGIAWTDHTTNLWMGCTKVGPGCDSCYAAHSTPVRVQRIQWGAGEPRKQRLENAARDLVKWNRAAKRDGVRRAVFINSLSDFFDNEVPQAWRDFAYGVFAGCDSLDIILLTKRIGNVLAMVPEHWLAGFPRNIRLGITVVHQLEAERDIPKLQRIPACVLFLSCEPLLGPLELAPWLPKLGWVIVGGESGAGARPFDLAWARSIQAQCHATGVPFFMKQLGARPQEIAYPSDTTDSEAAAWMRAGWTRVSSAGGKFLTHWRKYYRLRASAGADPAEWPEDLRVQQFPAVAP